MKKNRLLLILLVLFAFGPAAWAQFSGGDGTQANPYRISSSSDWSQLASNVNSGITYSGVYFKVTDIIYPPATAMIGNSEENSFQGIFDGNGQKIVFMHNAGSNEYAAPFRYVKNATFKRVYVDASDITYIASSGHYIGGLVGHSSGNTNISNCEINIVVGGGQGEGYHGGIVGYVADGVTTIDNCLFGGSLTGSSTHCGGFVGWVEGNNDARVILNNCLFKPETVTMSTEGSYTFVRSRYDSDVTLNNCYYYQTFGTAQGISSTEGVNLGSGWVSNSKPDMSANNLATATITGLPFWYDYTASAITVSYAVANADGTSLTEGTQYTAVIKDENGTELTEVIAKGTYTLTITGTGTYRGEKSATFHVGKLTGGTGTATDPYLIYSNADWNELVANVNGGNTYSGQYFKMTNDIRVTTSLGSNSDGDTFYSFNGTFDGAGHILHVTLNGSGDCVAPFTCINGATIKNLHVTGSISTTGMRPASIASFVVGNSTIQNCWSEVAISSSHNSDIDAGGFVARVNEGKTLTLTGCAFTGSITYSDANGYEGGGMVGFTQSNATATLSDCYFAPSAISIIKYNTSGDNWKKHWMFVGGRKRGTYTNCYYNDVAAATSMIVENKQARRITPGENMMLTNANSGVFYNVSGIASYRPGMIYDAKLYAGNGDIVNLILNYFGTVPEYYQVHYSASAGTLNGNVLTMPDADVVITATVALTLDYELLFTEQSESFYKFNYPSTNAAGEPITLSSLLAFWKPTAQMTSDVNNSVIINSHYTITADAQCPTHITNTLSADFPDYLLLQLFLSGRHEHPYQDLISKSVVIMPDYEGYGISAGSTHPYLAEELTAQQVVDGVRYGLLVYQELVNGGLAPQLAENWRSFSMGYSQGGAVALAVQRHIEQHDLSDTLHFRGTLCGDGPYDLITTLRYYMEDNGTSYGVTTDHTAGLATLPVVLPMILKGMIDSDPAMANYQITDYLTEDFLATGIIEWLNSKTLTNKQIATAWLQQLNNGTTTVNDVVYPAPANMSQMFSQHQVPTSLGSGTEAAPWADLSKVFTEGFYNYLTNASNFNNVPATPANAYQAMHRALANNNVCTGWEPSHRIMFMHSKKDMVVPYGNYLAFRDAHPEGENVIYRVDSTFSTSDHLAAGTTFMLNMSNRGLYFHWIDAGSLEWEGSGTEDDPWLISNVDEWLLLADRVKNGNNYSDKFFKMTDDISIADMVGDKTGSNSYATFNGTFDGDGHTLTVNLDEYFEFAAPFAYTYGATIKNLVTTGTITTSKQHAGGVVGRNGTGRLTLENVKSSVTINSSYSGDAQQGGLVGYTINADLIGCAFTGSILGESSNGCCGLIGWKTATDNSSVNITNCLFAPANITVGNTNAYTFVRIPNTGEVNVTNCYYTQALGTEQGKQAYSITCANNDLTLNFAGAATKNEVSGITSYTNNHGFLYNDGNGSTLIAGNGDNVSLKLTAPAGHAISIATYTPAGGTATEMAFANGGYSFTMPDTNVVINADMTACGTISLNAENDYTVFEDFESYTSDIHLYTFVTPECWTVAHQYTSASINNIGAGADTLPQLYRAFNHTPDGHYSLRMKFRSILAMPELDGSVDLNRLRLQMYVRQPQTYYKLQVGLMTELGNPDSFVPVALVNNGDKTMTYFECGFKSALESLGDYEHLYIAFKNIGGSANDPYCSNYLDDITLTYVDSVFCVISEIPYVEDFESYHPEIETGATGMEPDCWEVIPEDVALSSVTKPQLYGGFNMEDGELSDDGAYSLRLKNRCVYAMPALSEDFDIQDLTMTFSLRQTKFPYRLQVGVVNNEGEFELVKTFNLPVDNPVQEVSVDFAEYEGEGNRIAFRNTTNSHTTIEYSTNYIDDINIDYTSDVEGRSLANDGNVIDNMDAYLENVEVYPNPTTDVVNVQCTMNNVQCSGIEVIDVYGKIITTVGTRFIASAQIPVQINVSGLAAGMYFVRVTTDRGVVTKPFVKR